MNEVIELNKFNWLISIVNALVFGRLLKSDCSIDYIACHRSALRHFDKSVLEFISQYY